ncbi:major facilitator superfamily domain-containing protein [Xylaria palmicola]|nr:major facilitator superfamily domain-containing protein [Xylaria palmicola]
MWWPKMATAGQCGSGYAAVPPNAADQGHPTADVPDETRYVLPRDYHRGDAAAGSAQTTAYAAQGQWRYDGADGAYGSVYPAGGFSREQYAQHDEAAAVSAQAMQWNYQYFPDQANGVVLPQAVHHGQDSWAYYGNGTQYWNHHGVGQMVNEITPGMDAGQYNKQQHIQGTTQAQAYGQGENRDTPPNNPDTLLKPFTNTAYGHPDGWQHRNALIDPVISESHPRQHLTPWKWRLMLIASNFLSLINGYDVSNIANIQAPVYEAFGDIHLLPWLALSYSVCNVVVTPLARKLFKFYDIKVLTISGLVLLVAGNAVAGSASRLLILIIGRAVMAFGASVVYQGILSFSVIFSYPGEIGFVHASYGASFAFGILTGPVIGAGFAQNEHATWRWSFYICLPILVIVFLLCIFTLPSYSASTDKSVSTHFKEIDWVGHVLHSATFITFALAAVFSGSAWPWGSVPQLSIWVAFVTVAVAYVVQQTFSIGVKPERRILPVHLLRKRIVFLTFLCTLSASIAYGVTFYYEPLFYVFTRELNSLEAGLRLLCLTALFIATICICHTLLPVVGYYMPFFLVGGVLLLAGGIAHHTVTSHTSLPVVMVFSAILGTGIGVMWNLAIPVCSAVLETQEERLDQTTLHSIAQLGGTAVSLSISAAIYRNVGLNLVRDAAGFTGFRDTEILALLSGAKSTRLDGFSPDVQRLVIDAIVTTIGRLYYLVIAAAALCVVAALFLRIEPLQFKRWIRTRDAEDGTKGSRKGHKATYELR